MATLCLSCKKEDVLYTSNESKLLSIIIEGISSEECLKKEKDYFFLYHLDKARNNLFKWYNFDRGKTLLEIGSESGCLTKLFCEQGLQVSCYDESPALCLINYERNKSYDSLIIYSNDNDIFDKNESYDYIVIQPSYLKKENIKEQFKKLVSFLKPNGIILFGLPNVFNLSLLNGLSDDNSNTLFTTVFNNNIPTKIELINILHHEGFLTNHYYLNSDYNMPLEIAQEDYVKLFDYKKEAPLFNKNRLFFYNESEVKTKLSYYGFSDLCVSGYVIEASKEKMKKQAVSYYKSGAMRRKSFSLDTIVYHQNEKIVVKKIAVQADSKSFISAMVNNSKLEDIFPRLSVTQISEGIEMPWIEGSSLSQYYDALLAQGKKEALLSDIKEIYHLMMKGGENIEDYYSDDFLQTFGDEKIEETMICKKNSNIDLIFSNIIQRPDGIRMIIDYEWVMPFFVPQLFIFWRAIVYYYLESQRFRDAYSLTEILEIYNISQKQHNIFSLWDYHFSAVYSQEPYYQRYRHKGVLIENNLNRYLAEINDVPSLLSINNNQQWEHVKGISEKKDNINYDRFVNLEKYRDIKEIRWDPCEYSCKVRILECNKHDKNQCEIIPLNHDFIDEDGWVYFSSNDPVFNIINHKKTIASLNIAYSIDKLSKESLLKIISKQEIEIRELTMRKKDYIEKLFQSLFRRWKKVF